jgi:hypothetical protein
MARRAGPAADPNAQHSRRLRAPLTVAEILQLDAALMQAFRTIQTLRRQNRVAKYIKFPPLPSVFSESIVIASVRRLFGVDWEAAYGGKTSDVVIESVRGETKRVEVKATGEHAFQEFKAKDLRADFLVWIRFGRRFQAGAGRIEIALLQEPARFISAPCRLDTVRFERRVGATDHLRVLAFDSLEELLGILPAVSS